jgi:hypothetical protein
LYFREFQQSDSTEMIQIIRETWGYDRFCSPPIAEKLAKAYLYSCLADQTYTQVAIVNDIPAGIIMPRMFQSIVVHHPCASNNGLQCSICSAPVRGGRHPGFLLK